MQTDVIEEDEWEYSPIKGDPKLSINNDNILPSDKLYFENSGLLNSECAKYEALKEFKYQNSDASLRRDITEGPDGFWPIDGNSSTSNNDTNLQRHASTRSLADDPSVDIKSTLMFSLRMVFSMILSTDVLFPILIGNLSTFICSETVLNLHSGKFVQLVVVTPAIVFCMCFAIQESYRRRERALSTLAHFKASLISLEWRLKKCEHKLQIENKHMKKIINIENANKLVSAHIVNICVSIGKYLPSGGTNQNGRLFSNIYTILHSIHDHITNVLSEEYATRWIEKVIAEFEELRNLKEYRTPYSISYFSKIMIYGLSIVLGSYFAHGCLWESNVALDENCTDGGNSYIWCTIYFFILGGLRFVQSRVEHPYDDNHEINIDILEEMDEILKLASSWTFAVYRTDIDRVRKNT